MNGKESGEGATTCVPRDAVGTAPDITRTDLFVPHASTLTGQTGALLPIHLVRKRARDPQREVDAADRVVLFIHGASVPAPVAFDLEYRDYSWMEFLAREGFDVWAMSMLGYGWSARPHMDDPCNVDPGMQHHLLGGVLEAPRAPRIPHAFSTNQSEWDQIDTVVDYVLNETSSTRLSLATWSNGGPRGGGYACLYPHKVNRVVLLAPGTSHADTAVSREPAPGPLMTLQTRRQLFEERWAANAPDERMDLAPFDLVWSELMRHDPAGAGWIWEGVMRVPVRAPGGWSNAMVRSLAAPTLVIYGEQDTPAIRQQTFDLIGAEHKVSIVMDRATHFVMWESGRYLLHRASAEWLRNGTWQGASTGQFRVDARGLGNSPLIG